MKGAPSVAGTTYSSVFVYDRALVQKELLTLLWSSTTGTPNVAGTTYSSVLVYEGGPQCSRNYFLFWSRLRQGSLVQQELLILLSSSTTGIPSVAGTTYSSVLVYDGGPQCSRNYLLFCPHLRWGSLVQQDLLSLLSSPTMGIPSVAGSTYSSVLLYDRGPQCSRNYLLFCPHLRWGSLVQQELLTLLSSSTTGIPSVAGTTYSSVLVYEGGPQCSRNYLLFCPHLRWGSLVQQDLLSLLSSYTMGIPSVAGYTYSSVLLDDRGSLVQQELLTLLSSSTTGILSVAGTTYSSVLVYDRGPQCSRNYLLFCPRLRQGSLVQQDLFTLLSSSTKGVPSVAGTTYSSVLVYEGGPQCSRNYLLFCPRLRRESIVQQELLTLLSSSTMGVPSVAGTTYSSVLVYDGDPQCSRNYLLFCPRLRRGSLVQQELLTLLSSSTTGVPSVAGTTYSSVLVYEGGPWCSRNYLLFCPRLRQGSLVQQELLILLSSSTTGVPSVAGTTYSSVLVYERDPQCSRNYLLFCPHLRWDPQCSRNYLLFCPPLRQGSPVQQELLTLLSSSTTGIPSVAGSIYASVLVYDRGPQCSRNYLLFCPRLRRSTQCSRNYLLLCPRLRRGSLVYLELLTLLSSFTMGVPSVAGTTYSSVLVYEGGSQCSRNYILFCPRLRRGSLVQQELLTLLSSSTTGFPSVAGTTYSSA